MCIVQEPVERVAVITLRPGARAEPRKKVVWTDDTVDNEDMNKKKSKCCCIYVKPRKFDESESESSDSECEHCFGHVEKKRAHRAPAPEPATTEPEVGTSLVSLHTGCIGCCIYVKRKCDESESESSDSECEHCFGHVEKKRAHRAPAPEPATTEPEVTNGSAPPTLEPSDPAPSPPDKALPAT